MLDSDEQRERLAAFLRSCRDALLDAAVTTSERSGSRLRLPRADLAQMIAGFLAVALETVAAKGDSVRREYLDAMFSSLVDAGEDPAILIRSSNEFLFLAACTLALRAPPEMRTDVIAWVTTFLGSYSGDIAETLLDGGHVHR